MKVWLRADNLPNSCVFDTSPEKVEKYLKGVRLMTSSCHVYIKSRYDSLIQILRIMMNWI